jgi:DNA processing protein
MTFTEEQRRLLALCAIRIDKSSVDWSLLAREAQLNGLEGLWEGTICEYSPEAKRSLSLLREGLSESETLFERVDLELEMADKCGAKLVTVLDSDYPPNLRLIPNLPPFLFYRGALTDDDVKAVAVVGTRLASMPGLEKAKRLATMLAGRKVTVTSGLAKGIDAAAHTGALEAGGRTIAVLGTGITKTYPAENKDLAEQIAEHGALVSQFWPSRPPGRDTFPRRNVVTSGISQGTVVIEASATSGAKMQARLALEHGKKVFLVKSLVSSQPWAKTYMSGPVRPGCVSSALTKRWRASLRNPARSAASF